MSPIPLNQYPVPNTKYLPNLPWLNWGISTVNSGIKPPLLVVDPKRFYRSGESQKTLEKIRNPNLEIRISKSETIFKSECQNVQNGPN